MTLIFFFFFALYFTINGPSRHSDDDPPNWGVFITVSPEVPGHIPLRYTYEEGDFDIAGTNSCSSDYLLIPITCGHEYAVLYPGPKHFIKTTNEVKFTLDINILSLVLPSVHQFSVTEPQLRFIRGYCTQIPEVMCLC